MIIEKAKKWFTIKVQNNREKSISEKLKLDMLRNYDEYIQFLIPTKGIASVKNGKKIIKEQILYPGYLFVETNSIDKVEHLVKGTTGATNVLKDSNGKPTPMKDSEIERILGEKEVIKAMIESSFIKGEKVEIINGPFTSFIGVVESVDNEKNKIKVEVPIFGRNTVVDLTTNDINKCN